MGIGEKAFEIAEITSDNGLATQLELKDARLAYDQAKLNYFAAQYEYLEAYFDWELAVGITAYLFKTFFGVMEDLISPPFLTFYFKY